MKPTAIRLKDLRQTLGGPGRISSHHLDIIREAESFLESTDFDKLAALGIYKNLETVFWPAHTIVTYPFFRELESRNDIAGCLAQIAQASVRSANIYVHIPFCTAVCEYCAYTRVGSVGEQKVEEYIASLQRELDIWERLFGGQLPKATSLYFGGGTPTAIPQRSLRRVLGLVDKYFGAVPEADFSRSCEVSPETVLDEDGADKLATLKQHGISRISMGVQSFADDLAADVNRRHSGDDAVCAINKIRQSGFQNINIDLMYGLPGQDLDDWIGSLITATELGLPSITVHQLKIKDKSPLAIPRNLNRTGGWSQQKLLLFACIAKVLLEKLGYSQLGAYRFVLDKQEALQYQSQTYKMSDLLGVGCSSYSFIANCTTYNIFNQTAYKAAISEGHVPLQVGRRLTTTELMVRFLIYGLRIGVSNADFKAALPQHRIGEIKDYFSIIERFQDLGMVEFFADQRLRFSRMGILFANEIGLALARTSGADPD